MQITLDLSADEFFAVLSGTTSSQYYREQIRKAVLGSLEPAEPTSDGVFIMVNPGRFETFEFRLVRILEVTDAWVILDHWPVPSNVEAFRLNSAFYKVPDEFKGTSFKID